MMINIQQLLATGRAKLLAAHLQVNCHFEAELLLCFLLGKSRAYLYTWPEKNIDHTSCNAYLHLIHRRCQGEPIAYITGQREFWSLPFNVDSSTLIPRPETELLVTQVLTILKGTSTTNIVDLGTGCGTIALSLAYERAQWQITAIDKSAAALAVAKNNGQRFGLTNVTYQQGDWFEPLGVERYTAIVSNPPYIAQGDGHLQQGDVRFEPESALVSGRQGLDDIEVIIAGATDHLVQSGWLFLEHGYDQGLAVQQLFQQYGYHNIATYQDDADLDRVTVAQFIARSDF